MLILFLPYFGFKNFVNYSISNYRIIFFSLSTIYYRKGVHRYSITIIQIENCDFFFVKRDEVYK